MRRGQEWSTTVHKKLSRNEYSIQSFFLARGGPASSGFVRDKVMDGQMNSGVVRQGHV